MRRTAVCVTSSVLICVASAHMLEQGCSASHRASPTTALTISRDRAGLSEEEAARVRGVLAGLGPFPEPVRSAEVLRPLLSRDKKRSASGLAGVLLEEIGRARVEENVPEAEWLAAAARASLPLSAPERFQSRSNPT